MSFALFYFYIENYASAKANARSKRSDSQSAIFIGVVVWFAETYFVYN